MTRKEKNPTNQLPVQFKHLRFADVETKVIQANGGYTLAYRCQQSPGEIPGEVRIEVSYAFAECNLLDNFNKKTGRSIAAGRLNGQAPEFFDAFDITDRLPENYMEGVINLGSGLIDIHSNTFDIVRAMCEQFLQNFGAVLNLGNPEYVEGSLFENLVTIGERETLVIDGAALAFEEPTFEDVIYDANTTIATTCEQLLYKLENFNLEDSPTSNAPTLEEIRMGIKSIRDLADAVNSSGEDEEEEESEEGEEGEGDDDFEEDDEAEELDTESDDGGPVGDEEEGESDEDNEDNEEGGTAH